ncbi:MAG: MarR family transcriptional regulator [Erysipelotrichaceae bacterium]|nr:MarR family transcriptional regulator [Erysipelotrichaceae bacterium]
MEQDAGYLIKKIETATKKNIQDFFNEKDLTFQQAHVLRLLELNKGPLSLKQIREEMKISNPTMVGIINRMEKNGYVKTHVCKEDKRVRMVEQTDKSRKLGDELENGRKAFHAKMYKNISEKEKKQLYELLDRVYKNLQEVEENV